MAWLPVPAIVTEAANGLPSNGPPGADTESTGVTGVTVSVPGT